MKTADTDIHLETRAEIFRVAKRCAPCLDTLGAITFLADPSSAFHRRNWIAATWQPIVSVSLRKSQTLCRRPHTSLVAVDRELDERLAGPLAKSSRAAGLRLASSSRAPAGETRFSNYLQTVLHGESPGHFAVVFGARAGLFDVPPHITRAAMLFLEMRAARLQDLWPAIEDCLSFSPEPLKKLQAV